MSATERTLVLIKPDGVQRQLVGRILDRYEERGLKIVGLKLVQVDRALAERHYAAHREKPFFGGPRRLHRLGAARRAALDGPNAIAVVRAINGATRPHEAAPGTIRGDFALETAQNIVHASDGPETAAAELALWFRPGELHDYERDVDRWVLAPEGVSSSRSARRVAGRCLARTATRSRAAPARAPARRTVRAPPDGRREPGGSLGTAEGRRPRRTQGADRSTTASTRRDRGRLALQIAPAGPRTR